MDESNKAVLSDKLNWLRAGVLGANDGIVSTAGLVIGVASATTNSSVIATAGIAGIIAGAISMAAGEYVSVSSQRDTELALIAREKRELASDPDEELEELTNIYQQKGLDRQLAQEVAVKLTKKDAIGAHLETEFGLDQSQVTHPLHASISSAASFTLGALITLATITLFAQRYRILATFVSVVIALLATGYISAKVSSVSSTRVILRVVLGGALAMLVTYAIGTLFRIRV